MICTLLAHKKDHITGYTWGDFDLLYLSAISYTVKIRTADGDDNGTESHAWVNIIGSKKKKHTGKLYLDMIGKTKFEPGSVESFSLEAVDVGEVKHLEVGKSHDNFLNLKFK